MKAALVAAAFALLGNANAMSILGDEESCDALARHATMIALQVRDVGVSWEEFAPVIIEDGKAAMGKPGVYVKDEDDLNLAIGVFQRLWISQVEAEKVYPLVMAGCMKPVKIQKSSSIIHL